MSIQKRLKDARTIMDQHQIDCLILAPSTDLFYMTGFAGISMERPIFLAVTCKEAYFVCPKFELNNLESGILEHTICIPWEEHENPYEKAARYLGSKKGCAAVGNTMPSVMFHRLQQKFPEWKWCLGETVMVKLRSVKDTSEIHALKTAQIRSGNALLKALDQGLEGYTELEVALRLREYLLEEGLQCPGIPLVAAGKYGAIPHHQAEEIRIQYGDPVVIDFGGSYEGYYSDITRTVVVGKASMQLQEISQIVREANETAFQNARVGMTCAQLDRIARNVIEKAGYGAYFTHRLGHGIGLDIHEEPYIVSGNQEALLSGNTFSNEPGIYLPEQFGVRMEDVLAMEQNGAVCLTKIGHELLVVD